MATRTTKLNRSRYGFTDAVLLISSIEDSRRTEARTAYPACRASTKTRKPMWPVPPVRRTRPLLGEVEEDMLMFIVVVGARLGYTSMRCDRINVFN